MKKRRIRAVISKNHKIGRVRQYYFLIEAVHPTFKVKSVVYGLSKRNVGIRFRKGNHLFRKSVRAIGQSPLDFPITITRIKKADR